MKTLQDAGVKVNKPDKGTFIKKVQPMYDKIAKDELIGPLVEKVKNVE